MDDRFRKTFRIPSTRLQTWDYSQNGAYFVTICTQNRVHAFGHITAQEMVLSFLGQSAQAGWKEVSTHFPFARVENSVVMPNHVHAIITIEKLEEISERPNQFGPQSRNLASIIRGYKIGVTKFAKTNHLSFQWQERYYDHIIRTQEELEMVWKYIETNPEKWAEDKLYSPDDLNQK
jgi:REP element-mobilizing transposase RayT